MNEILQGFEVTKTQRNHECYGWLAVTPHMMVGWRFTARHKVTFATGDYITFATRC